MRGTDLVSEVVTRNAVPATEAAIGSVSESEAVSGIETAIIENDPANVTDVESVTAVAKGVMQIVTDVTIDDEAKSTELLSLLRL